MTTQQVQLSHPRYRPDIDGLRAVAVLAVVAFHAFPSWVRGGFIGVDIFFVISGYLISTIIFDNLDRGGFSFAEFYGRRIRRIFPALLLVLVVCFAFGWFTLLADEFKQLGKHIAAGAGFIANFIFWNEAGYFDNSAETKPLLHLWSLGIEEQFYIVWPLLLWFAWKRKFNLLTITIVVTLISFILNIKGIKRDIVATFYSPQTRFWELLSGSLLAWVALYKKDAVATVEHKLDFWLSSIIFSEKNGSNGKTLANFLSFVGMFLLLYGFSQINKELNFPGILALVPVLGAVLIILAGSKAWINRNILSNKVAVWFGIISFPLYLWHWPILSFARILERQATTGAMRIAAIAFAIAIAWLTYRLVERPLRFGNHGKIKVTILVVFMIIFGYVGHNTYSREGLSFRYKNAIADSLVNKYELDALLQYDYFKGKSELDFWGNGCFNLHDDISFFKDNGCDGPFESNGKSIMILGDSHSAYLSQYLRPYLQHKGYKIYQYSTAFCTPFTLNDDRERCIKINKFISQRINQVKPDIVLMFAYYAHYPNESHNHDPLPYEVLVNNYANDLSQAGVKNILLIGQIPTWNDSLPHSLLHNYLTKGQIIPRTTYLGVDLNSIEFDKKLEALSRNKNVLFVSLKNFLCSKDGCLTMVGDDPANDLIVFDYGHLTLSGAKYITDNLLDEYLQN